MPDLLIFSMFSGMVTLSPLWGYTYPYICIIYTHNHVHNVWFYRQKSFLFIPFLGGFRPLHLNEIKQQGNYHLPVEVAQTSHYFVCHMRRNVHFEFVCIYFASFKPLFVLRDNSSQFQLGQVEVRGGFSCTQRNVFPPPRLFWLYSSKPQDTQWMCKHLHFINQSGKATLSAVFTQSASSY